MVSLKRLISQNGTLSRAGDVVAMLSCVSSVMKILKKRRRLLKRQRHNTRIHWLKEDAPNYRCEGDYRCPRSPYNLKLGQLTSLQERERPRTANKYIKMQDARSGRAEPLVLLIVWCSRGCHRL